MKKYLQDYAILFLFAGSIVLLDQITKSLVRANLANNTVYLPDLWLSQYARIIHIQNTGAAFGLFKELGGIFTVLSFVVGAAIIYYFPQLGPREWLLRAALSLQLGGAIGNLLDRLFHGNVTDFISLDGLPVFNIADASISTGVALLVWEMWQRDRRAKQNKEHSTEPQEISREAAPSALPEDPQGE